MTDLDKPQRFQVIRGETKFCQHPNLVLDIENRVARCSKCDIALDVFDYLVRHGEKNTRLWFERKHLTQDVENLKKELHDIKRQVRNAKAALRRAKNKRLANNG